MPSDAKPVVIITGAGSGVGRAAALDLARRGYRCVLAGRTATTLDETVAMVGEQAPAADGSASDALAVPTDIAEPAAAKRLVERAVEAFGRVDALANIAGVAPLQPITEVTDEALRHCLAVNLEAVVRLTQASWPVFTQQGGGRHRQRLVYGEHRPVHRLQYLRRGEGGRQPLHPGYRRRRATPEHQGLQHRPRRDRDRHAPLGLRRRRPAQRQNPIPRSGRGGHR